MLSKVAKFVINRQIWQHCLAVMARLETGSARSQSSTLPSELSNRIGACTWKPIKDSCSTVIEIIEKEMIKTLQVARFNLFLMLEPKQSKSKENKPSCSLNRRLNGWILTESFISKRLAPKFRWLIISGNILVLTFSSLNFDTKFKVSWWD